MCLDLAQSDALQPLQPESAQRWYRSDCAYAGITKRGGIHTLRHCWATHLLEGGVDLHSLSQWLGHSQVSTTTRYLHLARPDVPDGARRTPLELLSGLAPNTSPPLAPWCGLPGATMNACRACFEESPPATPTWLWATRAHPGV